MIFKTLGPDGVQQRMEEIRRRMEEKLGGTTFSEKANISDSPSPLRGQIGEGTLRPLNPFGPGTKVQAPAELQGMIEKAANEAGIDPALLDAVVASESGYDPNARSRAGALGLSQLMPGTAAALGVSNPLDPWQNLKGGATYLSQLLKRFDGDPKLALAAYNAGASAVERYGGVPPYAETQRYVGKVLNLFETRKNA